MKSNFNFNLLTALVVAGLSLLISCRQEDNDVNPNPNNTTPGANFGKISAITIKSSSVTVGLGESTPLEATYVDENGNTKVATDVVWTTSNAEVVKIENGKIVAVGSGQAVITASVTVDGKTISSKMIVGVSSSTANALFTVAPQAIAWTTNAGDIPLIPVYLGPVANPNFTYTSSNESVIKVSSSGNVSFVAAGEATITVQANGLEGKPTFLIPVLVFGEPTTSLPNVVSRVTLTPISSTIFKGQTQLFTATAYNNSNVEITGNEVFWEIENDTNNFLKDALSINQTGLVTANNVGEAYVYATIKGIRAQAKIEVLPDSVLILNPYYANLDAGTTKQFTAELYKVNRSDKSISKIQTPSNIKWNIPKYADILPELSVFDIATVDQNGLVTMKSGASPGLATFLEAYIEGTYVYGYSVINVKIPGVNIPTVPEGGIDGGGTGNGGGSGNGGNGSDEGDIDF